MKTSAYYFVISDLATLDVADLSKAPVFDPSPVYGFGTWGKECVSRSSCHKSRIAEIDPSHLGPTTGQSLMVPSRIGLESILGASLKLWIARKTYSSSFALIARPHTISRRYEPQPFQVAGVYPLPYNHPNKWANETITPAAIKKLIEGYKGDPFGFQFAVEGVRCEGLHSALHYIFGAQTNVGLPGADMGDASYSPNGTWTQSA